MRRLLARQLDNVVCARGLVNDAAVEPGHDVVLIQSHAFVGGDVLDAGGPAPVGGFLALDRRRGSRGHQREDRGEEEGQLSSQSGLHGLPLGVLFVALVCVGMPRGMLTPTANGGRAV